MSIMSLIIGTKFDDGDQDHHYSTSIVHYTLAYIDILCGPPLGGRVTRYTPSVRPSVCLSVCPDVSVPFTERANKPLLCRCAVRGKRHRPGGLHIVSLL